MREAIAEILGAVGPEISRKVIVLRLNSGKVTP
jgi:hypothetical protein